MIPGIVASAAEVGGGWSPLDFGFHRLWLPSGPESQAIGYAEDATASPIPDEITAGNSLTTSTGTPKWRGASNFLNGEAAVIFEGKNDAYASGSWTALAQPYSVLWLGRFLNGLFSANEFLFDGRVSTDRAAIYVRSTNGFLACFAGVELVSSLLVDADPCLLCFVANGASSKLLKFGTQLVAGNAGTNPLSGLEVNQLQGGANRADQELGMLGTYQGDATADADWADLVAWAEDVCTIINDPRLGVHSPPQGDWVGNYGATGYFLFAWSSASFAGSTNGLPAGVTLSTAGLTYHRYGSSSDVRALENPAQTARAAGIVFTATSGTITLTFTNAFSGRLSLYCVDWDTSARRMTAAINDGSGARTFTLDESFNRGGWVRSEPISVGAGGTVTITLTQTAGTNAGVCSGLFLDPL